MNNDLISRDALIREIGRTDEWYKGRSICDTIDNALPVEITEEMAINKLHETGWLIGHDKEMTTRPQGEWDKRVIQTPNHRVTLFFCSECGKHEEDYSKFCPNCGADMRKGNAE